MAIDTLYIDKTLLISRLRMTSTSDTDTLTLIDQSIAKVRTEFVRRLGLTRVVKIKALTSSENPLTEDEIIRSVAETTEFYWVMRKLVCILPQMFLETSHAIQNAFDDVPITRDSPSLQKYLACLDTDIELGLGQMETPQDNCAGSPKAFSSKRAVPFLLSNNFPACPGFRTL